MKHKKSIFLLFAFLLFSAGVFAQEGQAAPVESVDQYPEFPGGDEGLDKFLKDNVRYPRKAMEMNISGDVYVSIILDSTGNITETRILKSPDTSLSEEALRVVNLMPAWTPGKQDGEPVSVKVQIPIKFVLRGDVPKKRGKG